MLLERRIQGIKAKYIAGTRRKRIPDLSKKHK
jgi:hypothetical protein